MSSLKRMALAAGAIAMLAASSMPALARGGHSQDGDAYLDDAQKNPRFIEPYAWMDPSRYRASNPQAGYDDRRRDAAARLDGRPSYEPTRYGRVEVRPGRPVRP